MPDGRAQLQSIRAALKNIDAWAAPLSLFTNAERNTRDQEGTLVWYLESTQGACPGWGPGMCWGEAGSLGPHSSPPQFSILPQLPATCRRKFSLAHRPYPKLPARQALSQPPSLHYFLHLECTARLFLSTWPTPLIPCKGPTHVTSSLEPALATMAELVIPSFIDSWHRLSDSSSRLSRDE